MSSLNSSFSLQSSALPMEVTKDFKVKLPLSLPLATSIGKALDCKEKDEFKENPP